MARLALSPLGGRVRLSTRSMICRGREARLWLSASGQRRIKHKGQSDTSFAQLGRYYLRRHFEVFIREVISVPAIRRGKLAIGMVAGYCECLLRPACRRSFRPFFLLIFGDTLDEIRRDPALVGSKGHHKLGIPIMMKVSRPHAWGRYVFVI